MWGHLDESRLLDLLEGAADPGAAAHVASCVRCRAQLEDARAGLMLARDAGPVPEPSPLYWESFRKQVDRRIDGAARVWSLGVRPALAAAAALTLLFAALPGTGVRREQSLPRTLPAWSALPPVGEDASFALLEGLNAGEEELSAEAARHGMADAVAELSEAEQKQLAQALQAELREHRGKKS